MNYKSPLCSCIVCHETKSAKGIFSHYLTSHTEDGKARILQSSKHGASLGGQTQQRKRKEKETIQKDVYILNPKKCEQCNISLPYERRTYKFCNHSCAATYNNLARGPHSTPHKNAISCSIIGKQKTIPPSERIAFVECALCYKKYTWHKGLSKIYCCADCCKIGKFNKQSRLAKDRGLGGVRQSVRINYNGVSLGSTYELILAQSLDASGVIWNRPTRMKYIDPFGKSRTYEADFYLPEYDVYLDPKNDFLIQNVNPRLGFRDTEKIRLVSEQNNVRVIILDKSQLSWESVRSLL